MRPTIRQVAQRAGVSRTTVSNVMLGRHDLVVHEKREAVLQAVKELQYVPVKPTLQNRHVETRVISMSLDEPSKITWAIYSSTYAGVCEGALKHGYDLLMLLRPDPEWAANRREVQFLDLRSDGVVFAAPDIADIRDALEVLARHKIPTVVCYRRDVPEGIAWVDPDNQGTMFHAVEHLVQMGHSRIAHLTEGDSDLFDVLERRRFFGEATHRFGIPECARWIVQGYYYKIKPTLIPQILDMGATAVVCHNDLLALQLWNAAIEGGFNVPQDLSIIGVDNTTEAETRGLTTVGFSYVEIGRKAMDAIVARIKEVPATECCHVIPVQLYARESVRNLNS